MTRKSGRVQGAAAPLGSAAAAAADPATALPAANRACGPRDRLEGPAPASFHDEMRMMTPKALTSDAAAAVPVGSAASGASAQLALATAAPCTPAKPIATLSASATGGKHGEAAELLQGAQQALHKLHSLVQQQAGAAIVPPQHAQQRAQTAVLQHTLQQLVSQLEGMPAPPTDQAKPTAGVSYVVHTESQQHGASGLPHLPHLVYQPPGLREVAGPQVDVLVATFSSAPTAAAVLPLREENQMKSYLLLPAQRRPLLQQLGGRVEEAPQGALSLEPLLQDRTFVCLHYHLDAHGRLHPCSMNSAGMSHSGSSASGGAARQQQEQQQYGIEQSNMQLGVMVRKGVGGTCPLRAAARRMAASISSLLDGLQPAEDGLPPPEAPSTAAAEPAGTPRPAGPEPGLPTVAATGQHARRMDGSGALCTPAPAAHAVTAANGGPGSAAPPAPAPPLQPPTPARPAAVDTATTAAAQAQQSPQAGCAPESAAGQPVSRSLVAAFVDALVGAAEAEAGGSPAATAAGAEPAAEQPAGTAQQRPASAAPAKPPAAGAILCAAPAAAVAQAVAPAPMQSSTADLEAALLRAAAELRAAEAAAAESAGAADEQLPEFEGEESVEEAAAASNAADAAAQGADDASTAAKAAAAAGVAGEEGAEELLRELQEQQQREREQQEQQQRERQQRWEQQPAPSDSAGAAGAGAAGEGVAPAPSSAPLPPVHPRLSFYTLSSRLELYVQQDTWENLDRPTQDALFSAVRSLELLVQQELAAANRRRLLDFCRRLQAAVSAEALHIPPGCAQLGGTAQQQAAIPAAAPLDFHEALALASACWLAADGSRGSALQVPAPYYLIGTRDSFTHHLVPISTTVEAAGRRYTRTHFYLRAEACPDNYHSVLAACRKQPVGGNVAVSGSPSGQQADADEGGKAEGDEIPPGLLAIGVTTYTGLFSDAELAAIEAAADELDAQSHQGRLPETCYHRTLARGSSGVKRTKYFFGARYTWTRDQLAEPDAKVAGGVRVDVPQPPAWMRQRVEAPLVQAGMVAPGFVDSIALNMYHDGSEGIQSHYDDADRFQQPILSLRLFSDSRLSFGTQLYGYTNGAFCVPLPRGCITVMEEGGYAANGIKHCVRPMDMSGKSAGMILRRINSEAREQAEQHHMDETCAWLRCLSLDASTRAATLLAGGAGRTGQQRQARTPAAERREIWRVLQDLIRRVEQQQRRDQLEDVTAQLMLLSAVRKVEAAERLGLDLCQDGGQAAAVLSVLDDVVSFVERPVAGGSAARQARLGARGKVRGSSSVALEVGSCLHHMVAAVEQQEQAEERQVVQVAYSMACSAAAAAEWEDSGRHGPQPAYALLALPHSTSGPSGVPGLRQPAVQAGAPTLPGGTSPTSANKGKPDADAPAQLQQEQAPTAAALRQQPLVAAASLAAPCAAAPPGADTPTDGAGSLPSAAMLQCKQMPPQQVGVGLAAATPQQRQAGKRPAAEPLAGHQQRQRRAPEAETLPSVYAAALAAPAAHLQSARAPPPLTLDSSNSSSCGSAAAGSRLAGTPRARRSSTAGQAPAAACFACCTGVAQEEVASQLWACTGPCRRTFHHRCRQPANGSGSLARRCQDCLENNHPCAACDKPAGPAGTRKCGVSRCCRYYHWDCLVANPLTKVSDNGRSAKCPLHCCAQCGLSGDGAAMVQCMLCDRAWHARCRPQNARIVCKRHVLCPQHGRQLAEGPAAAARTKPLAGRQLVGQQQQQQQQQQHPDDDTEDGELPPEGAEPSAACGQQQQQQEQQDEPPSNSSKRPRLAADGSIVGAAADQCGALRSPFNRSSIAVAAGPGTCQPSASLSKQQQQQAAQPPGNGLASEPTAALPDLDAVGAATPLSPRLSLQPSWQSSLASRASLDYGDL